MEKSFVDMEHRLQQPEKWLGFPLPAAGGRFAVSAGTGCSIRHAGEEFFSDRRARTFWGLEELNVK